MSLEVRVEDEERTELARLAVALTGGANGAADLLGETAVAGRRGTEHGYEADRALLVQRFLRRRGTRPAPEAAPPQAAEPGRQPGPPLDPAPDAEPAPDRGPEGHPALHREPDPPHGPGGPVGPYAPPLRRPEPDAEVQAVLRRLATLPPLARAVWVLRHHDQLTLAELVRVTERSPTSVRRALAESSRGVAAEPYAAEQAFWALPLPDPGQVHTATRRHAARRRRVRARLLLVGLAVVALLTGLAVLPGWLRPDPYVRARGEWVYSFALAPTAAYRVEGRTLSADEEVLGVTLTADRRTTCSVTVTSEVDRVAVPAGDVRTVGGRPARFVAGTTTSHAGLWWSVGPRTYAYAGCDAAVEDATLTELAGLVRFGPVPVRLPFRLSGLPVDDEVRRIFDYTELSGALVVPVGAVEESADALFVTLPSLRREPQERPVRTLTVGGRLTQLIQTEDGQSLCWSVGGEQACVGSFYPSYPAAEQRQRLLGRLIRTAEVVGAAPDLDDRSTWFDARDALRR
jgi:DNA-directed RNA polymerase specialized sigma24 family protein